MKHYTNEELCLVLNNIKQVLIELNIKIYNNTLYTLSNYQYEEFLLLELRKTISDAVISYKLLNY